MPKRSSEKSEENRIRKKLRKYEKKLNRIVASEVEAVIHEEPECFLEDQILQEPAYSEGNSSNPETLPPEHNSENDGLESQEQSTEICDTNDNTVSADKEPTVDPNLLLALGDCHSDTPEWGDNILEDISQRWEPIFRTGLKKEVKEDLYKKYLFPKNIPFSKPPELNPEIAAVLTENCRNRDTRVASKQNQLGRALAALGRAMTGLITNKMETSEIIRTLNDAGRLISDSHYLETDTRRSLITPLVDKTYVAPFKDRKRDGFLFGENLGEFIKSSRGIKKTGQLITPPTPTNNLNYKGPQRHQRNFRTQPGRGAGAQRPPALRRHAPAPPPPPPAQTQASRRAPPHSSASRRGSHASSRHYRNKT